MERWFGVLAILTGGVVLGFNPDRWDYVLVDFPGDGIRLHDFLGIALISVGTIVLWRARPLD